MKNPIYLDNQATTPIDPRVFESMKPYFLEKFGNSGSNTHFYGDESYEAVESSRKVIAEAINVQTADEIVFTSGATESDNLAIQGISKALKNQGKNHIITSSIEHKAVLDVLGFLENKGFEVTYLDPDEKGVLNLEDLIGAIKENTGLISLMHVNNEIGIINSIEEIGKIAVENGIFFHCDAAQSYGKLPIDVEKMNIHLLSLSAHKIYGPKGIGALYVRKRDPKVVIDPIFYGGGQEKGMRSGTLPTLLIVGFAEAVNICLREMNDEHIRLSKLRRRLLDGLKKNCKEVIVNGDIENRLPGNLNVSFLGVESDTLMLNLRDDIAVSSGSACTSVNWEGSYVLRAMGLNSDRINGAIRFGLGRFTREKEIDFAIECVSQKINGIKKRRITIL